ncbi:MAG: ABC transporter permease subunit [Acidimicrobiales bacterium]|nr:ABC transporter permease subunit [Acidimicrobiales bacterium]
MADQPGRAELRAVATQEALDALRGRRQLIMRAVTPIALFIVVLGATLVLRGADPDQRGNFRVAVEGEFEGSRSTLEALGRGRIDFEASDDAALATARGAHLGLRIPSALDSAIGTSADDIGQSLQIVVFFRPSDPASRAANALVRAGFSELRKRLLLEVTQARTTQITLNVTDVQLTEKGTRRLSSGLVPALLVLQASMVVAGAATRILGRRNRGLLIAQLLLPMSRWRMSLAKMLAEFVIGLATAGPVLIVVLLFVAGTSFGSDGVVAAIIATAATLITAAALYVPMAAVGLLIGTLARTQEQVSLGAAVAVIISATTAAVFALGDLPPFGPTALIPVAGLATALRDLLAGQGSPLWVLVGMVSSVGVAAAFTAFAARSFNSERLVLRSVA